MNNMFYPKLVRSRDYVKKSDNSYYSYGFYRDVTSKDCADRCIYCDVKLEEIGYEGFALDHFRPQHLFPELKDEPTNLVIACPKCNRFKSAHWPLGRFSEDSHDGNVGFFDPFLCNRDDYFEVLPNGAVFPKRGPSKYMIELLNINRASRMCVRKRRMLKEKIQILSECVEALMGEACHFVEVGNKNLACEKLDMAKYVAGKIKEIWKKYEGKAG